MDDVWVQAHSVEEITSATAAIAAGGSANIAGSTGVYSVHLTTKAFIDGGLTVAAGILGRRARHGAAYFRAPFTADLAVA